ncbi:MAG: transposase [Acidobacteria bacterium]|nr:transposase [Acidobacteriota bacterium]
MRPTREHVRKQQGAYFVSTQTARRQPFFRHDRWAKLCEATILHYVGNGYSLHAYVVMPDHLHLLITPNESLEKAVQLIKGGFSFRAKNEFAWKADIWQPGFSDHRIRGEEDWERHLEYIRRNPVKLGLFSPYSYIGFPDVAFPQGLKPRDVDESHHVRAEARTLPICSERVHI